MDPDYWWDAVDHLKPSRAGERKGLRRQPSWESQEQFAWQRKDSAVDILIG